MVMRLPFLFIVGVVLVTPVALRAEEERSPLAEARAALNDGDVAHAADVAREVAAGSKGRDKGLALFLRGNALAKLGEFEEAEKALAEAALLLPSLSDRVALARGGVLIASERPDDAKVQFYKARRNAAIELVAMRAELGEIKALLALGGTKARARAAGFLARYPTIPEKADLEFSMAHILEKQGRIPAAVSRYRKLWLEHPQSAAGELARERLDELGSTGARVGRTRHTDHLERVRRLISARQYDQAEEALAGLIGQARGSVKLHLQLELAIIAYRRGELERAISLLHDLESRRGPTGPWLERTQVQAGDVSAAVRRVLKGRAASRAIEPGRLVGAAEIYLDAGMYAQARRMLSFVKMHRAPGFIARWLPWIAFKLGDYDDAMPGLSRMNEERWSRGRRSYWTGRAHHKAGRPCEARASYESVIDRDSHGYYALWARQRLRELGEEVAEAESDEDSDPLRCPAPTKEAPDATARWTTPDPLANWALEPRRQAIPTEAKTLEGFESLIEPYGASLPWLARARDLWLCGDDVAAGEELNQTWWVQKGYTAPKSGLPNLWGGHPVIKRRGKRIRARFSEAQRATFADVARGVGETGLAVRSNRPPWSDLEGWHPLAYERRLRASGETHGLQPELLWSIMRVESYFDRHAISHANALGLMQILPRTGRRVAREHGGPDFEVSQLLDPAVAIDFSGWYMRALSDRFHGQFPLMVASYNGGPHNVASWITRRADTDEPLPMDEFLEEIPFTETYRYVRRVTASLAVYHALAGMPPPELPPFVDRDVTDGVNF